MWPFRDPNSAIPTFPVDNTIGTGSRVRGDLSGPGGFRVDGAVEGGIDADGPVIVGEGGSVEGGIRARDVVVLGRVRGEVRVSGHLEIGPAGKVLGDITAHSFRMHKGGVFRGTSSMPGGEEVRVALPAAATASEVSSLRADAAPRGRTLPPPNGAVPPPAPIPTLAELAEMPEVVADEAISQQRLIAPAEDVDRRRATGT